MGRATSRFVTRLHRRVIVIRACEYAGIGAAAGCAAALPLMATAIWGGTPALHIALCVPILGALVGVVRLMLHRPSTRESAIEADRQLGWNDLLTTAWELGRRKPAWADQEDERFLQSMLALTEQKCSSTSPSTIITHRLSRRAWSGIGLALAMVLSIGLLVSHPASSSAEQDAAQLSSRHSLSRRPIAGNTPTYSTAVAEAARHTASPLADQSGDRSEALGPMRTKAAAASADARTHSSANPTGSGGGSGRSDAPDQSARIEGYGASARGDQSGESAAGGMSTDSEGGPDQRAGSTAASALPREAAEPWRSATWPVEGNDAQHPVRDNPIPPQYQDLIREYFRR